MSGGGEGGSETVRDDCTEEERVTFLPPHTQMSVGFCDSLLHTLTLTLTHALTLSHTHSHSLTHTHTLSHTHSHSLSRCLCLSISLTQNLSPLSLSIYLILFHSKECYQLTGEFTNLSLLLCTLLVLQNPCRSCI